MARSGLVEVDWPATGRVAGAEAVVESRARPGAVAAVGVLGRVVSVLERGSPVVGVGVGGGEG